LDDCSFRPLKPFALDFYLATGDNPFYCGPDTNDNMARQMATCIGPSGSNKEYVYRLAESVRQLGPDAVDHHLFQLEKLVRMYDVAISH
jgi:glutathione-specific gamma-glutamylcyclotransferase